VGDTDVTAYGWDQRNRLVAVSHVAGWTAAQAGAVAGFSATGAGLPGSDLELRYSYDFADRRIRRSFDADGVAGAGQESVSYAAYAGSDRTLEIARGGIVIRDGGGRVIGFLGSVAQRNVYGPGEDEILAVDRVNGGTTSTFWMLADRLGTVRDIVSGNAADRGRVVEHRQYDSYGKLVSRTTSPVAGSPVTAGVGIDFGYAGRPLEERTGLSDNRARWYEPGTGRFVNEDPSGFKGGDANLFRYVGNDPLNRIDPSGLIAKWAQPASSTSVPTTGWELVGKGRTRNTFTGRPDWGIPFGEFLVTGPSNSSRAGTSQSFMTVGGLPPGKGANVLFVGVDGTGSAAWLSKVDANGRFVNERTQPDGTTRWNSHVRNLVADCNPHAMTIYSHGPAETDGGDSKAIFNAVVAAAEGRIRESGGGTTIALVGFSRGAMIASGVANALSNPPAGSPARQVAFIGMYDPVDMSHTIPAKWARVDARVENITIVGPSSGRDASFNVDYPVGSVDWGDPPFTRMALSNRITVTGPATNVSRFSYNASHGALGGTPGFNKRHADGGEYDYLEDVKNSIRADGKIRAGMRAAEFEFVPVRDRAWYGFPDKRPPASVRE
jgi:RHS repeat-associated protein